MDPGRFALKQGWDSNSALEGYSAVHEPDFRTGSSYGARRFLDDEFPRDPVYARTAFHRDILERDAYPHPPPVSGIWPQPRRSYDEEYALIREPRRHVEPFHEMENFHDEKYRDISSFHNADRFRDNYHSLDGFRDTNSYRDYGFDRHARFAGRDCDDIGSDHYDYRNRIGREDSRDRDYDAGRYNPDSDHERGRRDSSWRRRESRDWEREKRGLSREKDPSPYKTYERSRSRGREDRSRSRSPRARSHARSHREESYDDGRYERSDKRRDLDRDDKWHSEPSVAPSATVVVKGLSQKTTEEDLYQILAEWGPLRHVRVIKERNSGVSRGFAFIDFPTVEAARNMMEGIGDNCPVIDGRKLFFEYSSKPTGGAGAPSLGSENSVRSGHGPNRSTAPPSDWMCTMCGCVNFARRTSCFQCNEGRTDDSPPADVSTSNPTPLGRKGPEAGPTHVLVIRGLDENADEDMLRYEFSKHAPIKDLRLVRDKFTHVSRGFAFLHFHSVEDATKALDATNGTTLEKNGQTLRVAYAKSIHGPASGASQSSSLAAAAIEAAAFAQQYDSVGWAPKEYNAEEKRSTGGLEQNASGETQNAGLAPQSGFIWDEKSGYYYDAGTGFYYDGNTGLYYNGNNGIWYSYDHQSQQYVPCTDQSNSKTPAESTNETSKASDGTASKKVIISAPAITTKSNEKASLPDAVQAAATAALAAEKKEKEKMKEIKLASKNSLLASKKKMSNFLTTWKQRNNEGQAARVVLDDNNPSSTIDDKHGAKTKMKSDDLTQKDPAVTSGFTAFGVIGRGSGTVSTTSTGAIDSQTKARPVSNSLGGTIMGVIRGSGRGVTKADTTYTGSSSIGAAISSSTSITSTGGMSLTNPEAPAAFTPFKTDVSALGSYAQPVPAGSGKRRFSEMPVQSITHVEQPQTTYRDRAAERRSLYGSSSSIGDAMSNPDRDYPYRKGSLSEMGAMPFPPGVGGGRPAGDTTSNTQQFEVITADCALDESNVGNRMLRSMGWQEGLGLGKDGSGIKEPVQAKAVDARSGLGSQQRRASDPLLEAQAGDSYRTIIQKKAIARFREMS